MHCPKRRTLATSAVRRLDIVGEMKDWKNGRKREMICLFLAFLLWPTMTLDLLYQSILDSHSDSPSSCVLVCVVHGEP